MPGPDPRKAQQVPRKLGRRGKGGGMIPKKEDKELLDATKFIEDADGNKIFIMVDEKQKMAKGGRAGFKSGSKGCKLAMKGKGRAYGKNS